jgi:hypothetical protein
MPVRRRLQKQIQFLEVRKKEAERIIAALENQKVTHKGG